MRKNNRVNRIRSVSPQAVRRVRRSGNGFFLARLAMADEGGQVLPWVVVMMLTILGVAALVVDCGRAMVIQRELQSSTDAAALAAAQGLGVTSSYSNYATNYGSGSGAKNAYSDLNITGHTTTTVCLATVKSWGIPCTTAGGLATAANAIVVTQTTSVPTLFAGVLGKPSVPLSATSTATKSRPKPYNIALIVDSTLSMDETDSNCSNVTQEQCALQGVQKLLGNLDTNYDHVALFTFPNVVVGSNAPAGVAMNTSGASTTYNCTTNVPSSQGGIAYYNYQNFYTPVLYSINSKNGNDSDGNFYPYQQKHYQPPYTGRAWAMPYTFPAKPTGTTGYVLGTGVDTPSYMVTPFVEDYNDGSGNLSTSSVLVQAVGGKSGCGGIAPSSYDGDFGTYYPGAIYAAQAALLKEQANHSGSSNVMIILGDGNATAPQSWGPMYSMPDTATHAEYTYKTSTTLATGYTYPASYLTASSNGSYPSWVGECGQGVDAAQYAATYASGGTDNNTLVFTIAYGSPTTSDSGDCASDVWAGSHPNITPCQSLQQMATQDGNTISNYFYSDWAAQGGSKSSGCMANSDNSGTTAINEIYQAIVAKLMSARLIPNGTT